MTSEHDHGHPHDHLHDHEHEHDAACEVAHGTVPAPADGRVLVAVFATPVAQYLLRYAADAGYQPPPVRSPHRPSEGPAPSEGLARPRAPPVRGPRPSAAIRSGRHLYRCATHTKICNGWHSHTSGASIAGSWHPLAKTGRRVRTGVMLPIGRSSRPGRERADSMAEQAGYSGTPLAR